MKRIRANNDFHYVWSIVRNAVPEDLSSASERKLILRIKANPEYREITDYTIVDGNKLLIGFNLKETGFGNKISVRYFNSLWFD